MGGGGGRSGAFPIHKVEPKLVSGLCGSSNKLQKRPHWSTFRIRQGFNSDKYLAEGETSERRAFLSPFLCLFILLDLFPFHLSSVLSLFHFGPTTVRLRKLNLVASITSTAQLFRAQVSLICLITIWHWLVLF